MSRTPNIANRTTYDPVYRADGTRLYGLDAEIEKKLQAKRDDKYERDILEWISAVLEEPISPMDDFGECLKSGIVLCKLVNKISPDSIKKYNTKSVPLLEMENIGLYLKACWKLNVPSEDLFVTSDLYKKQGIAQVVQNIASLARIAQSLPSYTGPPFGPKASPRTPVVKHWEVEQPRYEHITEIERRDVEALISPRPIRAARMAQTPQTPDFSRAPGQRVPLSLDSSLPVSRFSLSDDGASTSLTASSGALGMRVSKVETSVGLLSSEVEGLRAKLTTQPCGRCHGANATAASTHTTTVVATSPRTSDAMPTPPSPGRASRQPQLRVIVEDASATVPIIVLEDVNNAPAVALVAAKVPADAPAVIAEVAQLRNELALMREMFKELRSELAGERAIRAELENKHSSLANDFVVLRESLSQTSDGLLTTVESLGEKVQRLLDRGPSSSHARARSVPGDRFSMTSLDGPVTFGRQESSMDNDDAILLGRSSAMNSEELFFLQQCVTRILLSHSVEFTDVARVGSIFRTDAGRREATRILKRAIKEVPSLTLSESAFELMLYLLNAMLGEMDSDHRKDLIAAKIIMYTAEILNRKGTDGRTEHIRDFIKAHDIWRNLRLWEECFWSELALAYADRVSEAATQPTSSGAPLSSPSTGSLADGQDVSVAVLKQFATDMVSWAVPVESIRQFVTSMCAASGLPDDSVRLTIFALVDEHAEALGGKDARAVAEKMAAQSANRRKRAASQRRRSSLSASTEMPHSHEFVKTHFSAPTYCQVCTNFIWGLGKQGYQCGVCHLRVHKKCLDRLPIQPSIASGSPPASAGTSLGVTLIH